MALQNTKSETLPARQVKPKATLPNPHDIEKSKLGHALGKIEFTDTDRINALITLFGGHYAFPVMWEVSDLFQNGRAGLDAFINSNPSIASHLSNVESNTASRETK